MSPRDSRDMTLGELHAAIVPMKREPTEWPHLALCTYHSNGMAGEAGEVANVVKKMARDEVNLDDKMIDECGDVLFYMSRLLRERGYTLNDAANALLEKLAGMQGGAS
jgi:NTP pyrophosphatase (non-canonical NTP hydrolase)